MYSIDLQILVFPFQNEFGQHVLPGRILNPSVRYLYGVKESVFPSLLLKCGPSDQSCLSLTNHDAPGIGLKHRHREAIVLFEILSRMIFISDFGFRNSD